MWHAGGARGVLTIMDVDCILRVTAGGKNPGPEEITAFARAE